MIDIDLLRGDPDAVRRAVAARGLTDVDVDGLGVADAAWRSQTTEVDRLRHRQKEASAALGGEGGKTERSIAHLRADAAALREAEEKLAHLAERRQTLWKRVPNIPAADVPVGPDASHNVVLREPRALPSYDFPLRDSLDIGRALGVVDVERATRASGSRFSALLGDGTLLAFSLVRHALDVLVPEGFTPVLPPVLLRREGMDAMGYLDRGADEVYTTQDELLLAGTSEQSLGAMHAGYTFAAEELPARFLAFSSCFRREAGSHGKDVRGIIRLHQFEKVEMFSFCRPEDSTTEHQRLLGYQRRLMDDVELPYRAVQLCTGDMGFPAASTVDIETWFPHRRVFVETHSTSNTTDFQTRRLQTRFHDADGSLRLVHALNGTAYAIQRTLAALLEVHQTADGDVRIPAALRPLMGGRATLRGTPSTSV